jgi:hypothetical protein
MDRMFRDLRHRTESLPFRQSGLFAASPASLPTSP